MAPGLWRLWSFLKSSEASGAAGPQKAFIQTNAAPKIFEFFKDGPADCW